jgi:hypothetical protein
MTKQVGTYQVRIAKVADVDALKAACAALGLELEFVGPVADAPPPEPTIQDEAAFNTGVTIGMLGSILNPK